MNKENTNKGLAVIAIAFFNFIFLGSEYLFDNMMAYLTDVHGVVLAQSYILGASVIGYVLTPFIIRRVGEAMGRILLMIGAISGVSCIFIVQQHASYSLILNAGLILFVLLGAAGCRISEWPSSPYRRYDAPEIPWQGRLETGREVMLWYLQRYGL